MIAKKMIHLQKEEIEKKDEQQQNLRHPEQSFPKECHGTFVEDEMCRLGKYILGGSRTPYIRVVVFHLFWPYGSICFGPFN